MSDSILKIVAVIALAAGLILGYQAWHHRIYQQGYDAGAAAVQGKWDKDKADRAEAEKKAVLAREKENQLAAAQQEEDRQRIEKAHHDELAKVRAAIARAPGLRVGPGVCAGFAAAANTKSTAGGDGTDPGSGMVREDVRRDLDALKLRVEEAFAAGRACQAFIAANGMAP